MEKPLFIVGPCVIESQILLDEVAQTLVYVRKKYPIDIIFKASFDKANRTSLSSFRGPGLEKGLQMLSDIKSKYSIPITTDIHESYQAAPVGEVCDVIQIPAFLCRQTDLLVSASKTGRVINIKKAQFLSAPDMRFPVEKCRESGAKEVWLTERGTIFGPGNLVVDFRNLEILAALSDKVIMDCTHSCQKPSACEVTGGDRHFAPMMAKAAKVFGAQGYFFETHPEPDKALSDAANMVYLKDIEQIIIDLQ